MKKLFFFKSSSSNGTSNLAPSQSKDKHLQSDNLVGSGLLRTSKSRPKKAAVYEDHNQDQTGPFLRRSRSYSSAAFLDSRLLRTRSDSPCSSSTNFSQKQSASRSSRRALTPERPSRSTWFQDAAVDAAHKTEKIAFAGVDNLSSESSSYGSSKVLDRYIDGEQDQEWTSRQINSNTRTHVCQPNGGGQKPPRVQYAAPVSPTGVNQQRPRSHSFRDPNREAKLYMSTRDWVENAVSHESPRKLAKQVVERLSQSRVLPRADSKEFDHDMDLLTKHLPRDGPVNEKSNFEEISYKFDDDCNKSLDYEESEDADEITLLKAELDCRTRKLEKERNELQLTLEKELDRRSTEWSMKLEKCKTEEHRLRQRVRELAEQNVSLQREVSLFGEKELDNENKVKHSGQQVNDLTMKMDELVKENKKLHQNVLELKDKYTATEEDRDLFKTNFESKDKECKELYKAVTRLLRTTNEQDKTIEGLREGFSKEARNFDQNQQSKMQTEHLRLTGVEQALRKEVESYRLEAEFLRHENINLLNRLKGNLKDGGFSTIKLDQELSNSIHCLQNQGTSLINDSIHLCQKLIENIKERALQNGLDSQFIMEADMKLQGFKRGAKSLTKSLQTVSNVQRDKSSTGTLDNQCSEDLVKSELKAETLMTILLREKLYSKEVDVERLEAELATAVRGNDILRCEVQNAMDNLSCVTHKMKDLEMQVFKKDESIYHLQNNLQECRKELSIVNGLLPKVSEERDMMWDEVKQYSENNMLLTSEVGMLKKKVEALDEDVLLKEGQITILKDALGKPFDLLSSSIPSKGFLV
ncbi:hypothetical protein M8C21_021275 [Ambrosia artemisiifolia]|uniref:DUF7653 domain-containing protein n=1 Tax=Ambrosia artemisiifolia TaxID=4212 RepID=A0AAD5D350_AMBAR|nr:hypothetical protein M8C21_021275 [Ambrosia artemisiifolia]